MRYKVSKFRIDATKVRKITWLILRKASRMVLEVEKMFSIIAISRFTQYSFIIKSICISALIEIVRGKPKKY